MRASSRRTRSVTGRRFLPFDLTKCAHKYFSLITQVLEEVVALGYLPDEHQPVVELLRRVVELQAFREKMIAAGAVSVLLHILKVHDAAWFQSTSSFQV